MKPKKIDRLKRVFAFQIGGMSPTGGILFGAGAAKKVGVEAKKFGKGKVFLVTDKTIEKLGLSKIVEEPLREEGFAIDVFSDVEPEPTEQTADAVAKEVRKKEYNVVVGVGGGSVLDMAKMASIVATNAESPRKYMEGVPITKPTLPKILIPTTSGTGSEVSPYIVMSVGDVKKFISSPHALANIAIVDPIMTMTCPPAVTAGAGFDALSHAIESMMSTASVPITDVLGMETIKLIFSSLRKATFNGKNLEARYNMALAATLGMMAYANVGGLYAHSISYVITIHSHVPHGVGCGVALPYTMRYNLLCAKDKLAMMASAMGENVSSISTKEAAERAVNSTFKLLKDVGLPTNLKELKIPRDDIPHLAETLLAKYPRGTNPRRMTIRDAKKLFEDMWEGKPFDVELE